MTTSDFRAEQLLSGLAEMSLDLDSAQQGVMLDYLGLLQQWNRAYNLTAVRDPSLWVSRHLLDSLSILPWLKHGPVLDVGSGAGLPGIPLAIARPQLAFTLVDSNRKRTRFLQQVVGDLGLDHVEIVHQRVEGLSPPIDYATVISRAFASLADMVTATAHLLSVNGTWLAMKGKVDPGELSALPETVTHEVVSLSVPGESASRHLVVLTPRYLD
jgi:16S rRNA (guanine527-N7)-methyltransferase